MTEQELLERYALFTLMTYPTVLTEEQSVCNCAFGLLSELNEWVKTEAHSEDEVLEAGDVLYYAVTLAHFLEIPLGSLILDKAGRGCGQNQVNIVWQLTDTLKKHYYYHPQKYDRASVQERVTELLQVALGWVLCGYNLQDIITGNTRKLSGRYGVPDPFEGVS